MTNRVYLVSYPRSGQHYTQRLLERATGEKNYCGFYNCLVDDCPGKDLPREQRRPCLSGMRFQKSHDFDLKQQVEEDALYVTFWRRPLFSITSFYEWTLPRKQGMQDTRETWLEFAAEKARYWRDFVTKWAQPQSNILHVRYEEMTERKETVHGMFAFCFDDYDRQAVDRLMHHQRSLLTRGDHTPRRLEDFRYDIDEAAQIVREAIGAPVLQAAGYDDVM